MSSEAYNGLSVVGMGRIMETTKTHIGSEAIEPVSIQRLQAIRPGQEVVYYTGTLPHDIEAADDSPDYARLLGRIADLATKLQEQGRVRLVERDIQRRGYKTTRYSAVGLPTRDERWEGLCASARVLPMTDRSV